MDELEDARAAATRALTTNETSRVRCQALRLFISLSFMPRAQSMRVSCAPSRVRGVWHLQVMGFVANLAFNLHVRCRAALLADPLATPLSPRLLLRACAALRPTIVNTVPWCVRAHSTQR
jgi:hypothetical protein